MNLIDYSPADLRRWGFDVPSEEWVNAATDSILRLESRIEELEEDIDNKDEVIASLKKSGVQYCDICAACLLYTSPSPRDA